MVTHKVYLTESQLSLLIENQLIIESMFSDVTSFSDLLHRVKKLAIAGGVTASLLLSLCSYYDLTSAEMAMLQDAAQESVMGYYGVNSEEDDTVNSLEASSQSPWTLTCDGATATVYNATPSQCNADCGRTASMFRLNLSDVYSHRIIAIERTMMERYGLQMGDVVYLEGVGKYDGIWQVQDKMNKKFAGMDKIDLLVNGDVKYGKWEDVKIYTLKDKSRTSEFKSELAPQLSKTEFNSQFNIES